MKVAISTDNGMVSAHFGRCPQFTILEIEDSGLKNKEVIENPGHHPGYLPEFLKKKGVNCIIAGGMGNRAKDLFDKANIDTFLGIQGSIDQVTEGILNGTLEGAENICSPGKGKGYGVEKTDN